MKIRQFKYENPRSSVVPLTGGLNEQEQILEMSAGELLICLNYEEVDGEVSGYRSVKGFEVFDGQQSPSEVPLVEVNGEIDDTNREAARDLIEEIPGVGVPSGGFVFNGSLYAVRNNSESCADLYKATLSGWEIVPQPEGFEFQQDGKLKAFVHRFDGYNNNQPVVVIVDGVSYPRIFNGTDFFILDSTNLPPDKFPHIAGVYDHRLFLGYREGSVIFSGVGDPTDFSEYSNAGEIFFGDDLTNIVETPGNTLALFFKNSISFLKSLGYEEDGWVFQREVFSRTVGAFEGSALNFLGDVYFASDIGVLSLLAAQEFGDFSIIPLTKKVHKTYAALKESIVGSLIDNNTSQYKLFFNNGKVLAFSFNTQKGVKGVTNILYPFLPVSVFSGELDGERRKFVIASDGFCYEIDRGTSFNGSPIPTRFATAFYHYNSPRNWKKFKRIQLDISGESDITFSLRPSYTYGDILVHRGEIKEIETKFLYTSRWGEDKWGEMIYGGGMPVKTEVAYILGVGTVMSVCISSFEKYKNQHTIQNLIVDYNIGSRRI